MKLYFFILLLTIINLYADRQSVNSIAVIIHSDEQSIVITKTDLERPTIEGRQLTPRDWIVQWLLYLDAKNFMSDHEAAQISQKVKDALTRYREDQGLSIDDLKNNFKMGGYTYEEACEHYGVTQLAQERLRMEFDFQGALRVSPAEIYEYWKANPILIEGSYTVRKGYIRESALGTEKQKEDLLKAIKAGSSNSVTWLEPYTINESELVPTSVIRTLDIGEAAYARYLKPNTEIRNLLRIDSDEERVVELVQLVGKEQEHPMPLEQRKEEIAHTLRDQKIMRVKLNLEKKLLQEARVNGLLEIQDPVLEKEIYKD